TRVREDCAKVSATPRASSRGAVGSRLALLGQLPMVGGGPGHEYDVSGLDDSGGFVYGSIDASRGEREVEGTVYDEDGEEHSISGEWSGKGEVDATDDDGNTYDLDVE